MSNRSNAIDHAILSDFLGVERPPEARDVDLNEHLAARTEEPDVRPPFAFLEKKFSSLTDEPSAEDQDVGLIEDLDGSTEEPDSPSPPGPQEESFCWTSPDGSFTAGSRMGNATGEPAPADQTRKAGVDGFALSNAVARLVVAPVLEAVQAAAPWEGRESLVPLGCAVEARFLFAVRWHTESAGELVEAWTLGYLPEYEHYVLVSSLNHPRHAGYGDLVEDFFEAGGDPLEQVAEVLVSRWGAMYPYASRYPWEEFRSAGAVDRETAVQWALRVWPPEVVESTLREPRPPRETEIDLEGPRAIRRELDERERRHPVEYAYGHRGYRVFQGTGELVGTYYMEIRPGRGQYFHWQEDALYVSSSDFYWPAEFLHRHVPHFDVDIGDCDVPKGLGLRVAAEWEEAGRLLEEGRLDDFKARFGFGPGAPESPAARQAMARMYRDLAEGVRALYERGEWVCIIGWC